MSQSNYAEYKPGCLFKLKDEVTEQILRFNGWTKPDNIKYILKTRVFICVTSTKYSVSFLNEYLGRVCQFKIDLVELLYKSSDIYNSKRHNHPLTTIFK